MYMGEGGGADGLVSFDAWPKGGKYQMMNDVDEAYKKVLGDKTYMMGVSPYFYTSILSLAVSFWAHG